MAGFISRVLEVYLIFILFSGSCTSSKLNRLERRVNILENKVDYNSDVFADDIETLFSLVNRTDAECVRTSTTQVVSSSKVEDTEGEHRLTVSLRKAFQQEKTLLRSMEHQLQQNWTRVNEDLTSRLTDIQAIMDDKEHDFNTQLNGIRENQTNLLQKMLTDVQDKQKQIETTMASRLDLLLTDINTISENQKKMDTILHVLLLDNGWKKYNSSYYLFSEDSTLTWSAAVDYCSSLDAELVEINTAGENSFLKSLANGNAWIGGYLKWNTWQWRSGNKVQTGFTNWAPGEPNFAFERCMELSRDGRYQWNNIMCSGKNHAICKFSF